MAIYRSCPNCGNSDSDDSILQCTSCNEVFCDACTVNGDAGGNLSFPGACPNCESHGNEVLGSIEEDDDDE